MTEDELTYITESLDIRLSVLDDVLSILINGIEKSKGLVRIELDDLVEDYHAGAWRKHGLTKRQAEVHGCTVMEIRNDKVIRSYVYWDTGHLLRQLGVTHMVHIFIDWIAGVQILLDPVKPRSQHHACRGAH